MKNIKSQPTHFKQISVRWLVGLAMILELLAVFTDLAEDVFSREGFYWDKPIILAVHSHASPILDIAMWTMTQMGETGAIAAALLASIWFFRKKKPVDGYAILISFLGAAALNTLLKLLLTRPRPDLFPPLVPASGFSFPSGHVTAALATFGFLAVWLWREMRYGWAIACASFVPLVALSRIYLGVHYPSDTLGSLTFASLWLIVVFSVRGKYMAK